MELPISAHDALSQVRALSSARVAEEIDDTSGIASRTISKLKFARSDAIPDISRIASAPTDTTGHLSEMRALDDAHVRLGRVAWAGREDEEEVRCEGTTRPSSDIVHMSGRPTSEVDEVMRAQVTQRQRQRKTVTFSETISSSEDRRPPPTRVADDLVGPSFEDDEELTSTPLVQTPVLPSTIIQSSRRRNLHGVRSRMSFAPSSIVGIELGLLSEEEIRRMAMPITETEKLSENGVPKVGGVNDPRQGVTQNRFLCPTCGCDALECNGHLGMIVMPWPVYNVGQFLSSVVENLNMVCWACCSLRIAERRVGGDGGGGGGCDQRVAAIDATYPPGIPCADRVAALAAALKNVKVCPCCEAPQPTYTVVKAMHMVAWNWLAKKGPSKKVLEAISKFGPEMAEQMNRPFTAARAYDIFAGVSDEDWAYCGVDVRLAHPKNKILRVLPVAPNCIRPTFSSTEGSSMQGMPDMTTILHTHIAKTVNSIWKAIARGREDDRSAYRGGVAPDHVPEDVWKKRTWQDIVPSQVFRKARATMAAEMAAHRAGSSGGWSAADDDAIANFVYTQRERNVAAAEAAVREETRRLQAPQIMSGPRYAAEKRRASTNSILTKLGGNWLGEYPAKDIAARCRVADPTEEQRVRALVESTRPDVLCKTARTWASLGVEGAEWAAAALPHEYEKLQLVVATLFLNDDRTFVYKEAKQRNGAPLRGIDMFLKGKTGLVKGSLMAVRSFFSARSVVTAAAGELDMDELGVPADFARTLTFPERVTNSNIEKMRAAVKLGPNVLDGAAAIVRAGTGERVYLTHIARAVDRLAIQLKVGDVVERHLVNGDYVMINRQPTLHKGSCQVMRVRIMEGIMAFRLHLAVTEPMNCDFDGDEINIHVPQTIEAVAELQQLMASQWQIMLPKNNAPCIGPVQDLVSGLLRITRKDVFLTRERMMHLAAQMRYSNKYQDRGLPGGLPPPAILHPKKLWTGKQAISILLPEILNLERAIEGCAAGQVMDPDERIVCIQAGELLSGVLTKTVAGISSGGIIQRITMDGGARMIKEYISDMARVVHEWFREHGFSIGIDDVTMPASAHMDTHRTLASAEIALTRAEHLRDAQVGVSSMDEAKLETAVFAGMSAALERASDVERAHRASTPWARERALDDMIRSGSKGKNENRESLKVGLGVTIVGAARIARDARGKTIPGFLRFDPSPASQGFVRGNYMDGINPMEYYFHAMAGRRGLADTAVKTSETGYMQKRGTKVMEDKIARCDGSIRGKTGVVVQACYGGDGMDPMKVEMVEIPVLAMGDSEVCASAGGSQEYQSTLLELRDTVRSLRFSPTLPGVEARVQLPIHAWNSGWCCSCPKPIEMFLRGSIFPPRKFETEEEEAEGDGADERAHAGCSKVLLRFHDWMKKRHGSKCATMLLSALWELRPSRVVANGLKRKRPQVDLEKLQQALTIAASRYERALVCEGEATGVVAAQSIGEPSTQMTLNTFHTSGKGNAHMSMGVPRIHEIFDKRKSESMVSRAMTLACSKNTRASAEAICRKLRRVSLSDVVHVDCFVVYDPVGGLARREEEDDGEAGAVSGLAEEDGEMADMIAGIFGRERDLDPEGKHFSPFVIRIQLDQKKLLDLGIPSPISTIVNAIRVVCPYPVSILHSDESADAWVVRVRIWDPDESPNSPLKFRTTSVRLYSHILERAQANGAQKLHDPFPCEVNEVYVNPRTKRMETRSRWSVSIRGSSLPTAATIEGVDWDRTVTNDLNEIEREMGICAAEDAIAAEMYRVFTYDGSHVDKRHLSLVASAMTVSGRWFPLTRHGLSGMRTSALHQASFEQTSSKLREGASNGQIDLLDNPASAMCVGASVPVGTGCVAIIKDFKLPSNTQIVTRRMMMELQNGMIRQASAKPKRRDTGAMYDAKTGLELKSAARSASTPAHLMVTTGPQQPFTPIMCETYAQARDEHVANHRKIVVQDQLSEKAAQIIERAQKNDSRRPSERSAGDGGVSGRKRAREEAEGRGANIIERGMRDVVRSKRHVVSASVEDPFGLECFDEASIKRSKSRNASAVSKEPRLKKLGITTTFVNSFGKVHDVVV